MTTACPVHPARNVRAGRPRSGFFALASRIARRFDPVVAGAFRAAVSRLQEQIDEAALRSALAAGNLSTIEAAAHAGHLGSIMLADGTIEAGLLRTATVTGAAGADVLSDASGLSALFNARDPNVVLFAREQAANLIVGVGEDVREAVRIVVAAGSDLGLTTVQQARAIREVVGLPPNWARAPLNLAEEIRAGHSAAATARRLSAADKASIRARIAAGTVDDAFVRRMQEKYTASLLNRRALNIARTETLTAAHHGQREGWKQAVDQGVLPATARRMAIVTPDDRLRATHAAVPGMNPSGVRLDEPFATPFGPLMSPPWEPLCRCGVGLIFPGRAGVL